MNIDVAKWIFIDASAEFNDERSSGEELIEIALGRFQPLRGALESRASKMLRIL